MPVMRMSAATMGWHLNFACARPFISFFEHHTFGYLATNLRQHSLASNFYDYDRVFTSADPNAIRYKRAINPFRIYNSGQARWAFFDLPKGEFIRRLGAWVRQKSVSVLYSSAVVRHSEAQRRTYPKPAMENPLQAHVWPAILCLNTIKPCWWKRRNGAGLFKYMPVELISKTFARAKQNHFKP